MSAYHNPDWAECYDLWVRHLFGSSPSEDIPIFAKHLTTIIETKPPHITVSVIDVGTGSGRVLINLQDAMQAAQGRRIEAWGVEPSSAMLDRAKRFWDEAVREKKAEAEGSGKWEDEKISMRWLNSGAEKFADEVLEGSGGRGVDLVIFAVGSICHISEEKDVARFLKEVSKVLIQGGKAIIAVLREFMSDETTASFTSGSSVKELSADALVGMVKPYRVPSKDHPGIVYVKHPATETTTGDIKTESFRLDVEDVRGTLLRTHDLSWDVKMFDRKRWEEMLRDAGLTVAKIIEGQIQVWWVLEKSDSWE